MLYLNLQDLSEKRSEVKQDGKSLSFAAKIHKIWHY